MLNPKVRNLWLAQTNACTLRNTAVQLSHNRGIKKRHSEMARQPSIYGRADGKMPHAFAYDGRAMVQHPAISWPRCERRLIGRTGDAHIHCGGNNFALVELVKRRDFERELCGRAII